LQAERWFTCKKSTNIKHDLLQMFGIDPGISDGVESSLTIYETVH